MSEQYGPEATPSIEVRVFRGGDLIERQLCESEAEASELVERWAPTDETYPPS